MITLLLIIAVGAFALWLIPHLGVYGTIAMLACLWILCFFIGRNALPDREDDEGDDEDPGRDG